MLVCGNYAAAILDPCCWYAEATCFQHTPLKITTLQVVFQKSSSHQKNTIPNVAFFVPQEMLLEVCATSLQPKKNHTRGGALGWYGAAGIKSLT